MVYILFEYTRGRRRKCECSTAINLMIEAVNGCPVYNSPDNLSRERVVIMNGWS
jgi:hypothetical protein